MVWQETFDDEDTTNDCFSKVINKIDGENHVTKIDCREICLHNIQEGWHLGMIWWCKKDPYNYYLNISMKEHEADEQDKMKLLVDST